MQANADRLAALRGSAAPAAAATTVYMPKAQQRQQRHNSAVATYRQAQAADAERAAAATQSKPKPIVATFCCCICITKFERDVTNDPDGGRPSPLGDTCDACRAAGKLRPFEAAGMTIVSVMVPHCRFCQGDHWAMNCPTKPAST